MILIQKKYKILKYNWSYNIIPNKFLKNINNLNTLKNKII